MDASELLERYAAGQRDFSRVNLSGADLSGVNLSGVDHQSRTNLSGTDLRGVKLRGARLHGVNLSDAKLSCADLSGANLTVANLSGAKLFRANLKSTNLQFANLRFTDFSCTDLSSAVLTGAVLDKANLTKANISRADFRYTQLINACLIEANLIDSTFIGANLTDSDLQKASFYRSNLAHAKLIRANLTDADLTDANLARADLTNAILSGVNLEGTILSKTQTSSLSKIDWTTLLRVQQTDFIQRISSGCLLHCAAKGQHSELTIISGERLRHLRDFCWKMAEKYKRDSPIRKVFIDNMKGKLGEEVVKTRLGNFVTEVDYEQHLGGDSKVDFRLTTNPRICLQVKARHGNINSVQWWISQEEVQKNAALVCVLIQEEVNEAQLEYNLILAGFLPASLIERDKVGINQLLYGGGLRSYLESIDLALSD